MRAGNLGEDLIGGCGCGRGWHERADRPGEGR